MAEKKDAAAPMEKLQALEAARLQIEKQFGQGSLMKLGAHTDVAKIDVIPSGSILLDEALGIGGYPRGRIIEMYGPESSGKTTLALHAVAEAQGRSQKDHSRTRSCSGATWQHSPGIRLHHNLCRVKHIADHLRHRPCVADNIVYLHF